MEKSVKNRTWIMNCPPCEAMRICNDIKLLIADLKTVAFKHQKEELEHCKNELDFILTLLKLTKTISQYTRNQIRLIGERVIKLGELINDFYQNSKN